MNSADFVSALLTLSCLSSEKANYEELFICCLYCITVFGDEVRSAHSTSPVLDPLKEPRAFEARTRLFLWFQLSSHRLVHSQVSKASCPLPHHKTTQDSSPNDNMVPMEHYKALFCHMYLHYFF